jgi:threonine 3-dehydrogenase
VEDSKLSMALELGADIAINTKKDDFVKIVRENTEGRGADVVIDYTGNARLIEVSFEALSKGGRYTMVGLPKDKLQLDLTNQVIYKEANINGVTGRLMYQTWWQCENLLKKGNCDISKVIGGIYKLEEFEKAFADIEAGMPGKMILQV